MTDLPPLYTDAESAYEYFMSLNGGRNIRHLVDSLDRYGRDHIEPGSFLRAVLENDLQGACAHADEQNRRLLFEIVIYLENRFPTRCWGSPVAVAAWLRMGSPSETDEPLDPEELSE